VTTGLLRVGSYNVMDGGGDRWRGQIDLLASLDLDILGIQEAKHWDRDDFERMYATGVALGLQPLFAPSARHGCHLVLLYRWPRLRCQRFRPDIGCGVLHHTASRARFAVEGVSDPVHVIHTHLDPFSPQNRVREVGWMTEFAAPSLLA
jgi:endonuclease/exonuclease/phosphatase family metal-dependent hydrolase